MNGDSVVKTLLILFAVVVSPCILAVMVMVFYVWVGLAMSHG